MTNEQLFSNLQQHLDGKFDAMESRLDSVDARISTIESRMTTKGDLADLESRMATKDDLTLLEDHLGERLDIVQRAIGETVESSERTQQDHNRRIQRLEHRAA